MDNDALKGSGIRAAVKAMRDLIAEHQVVVSRFSRGRFGAMTVLYAETTDGRRAAVLVP